MKSSIAIFCTLLFLLIVNTEVIAANKPANIEISSDEVLIGTRVVPPFVIKNDDGTYSGLTVELWKHIANELDITYQFTETDITGMLNQVADNSYLASASALTITAERESQVDFTHPFFVTGLGIAVSYKPAGIWEAMLAVFSTEFLYVLFLLFTLLMFWGLLVWFFERKKNTDEFGGTVAEGIGSGFWWAAVTMTTVGYGDKSPKTLGGRIVGFVWMFAAIILISFFTASIASSLTVTQLSSTVSGPEDLPFVRVGVLENAVTVGVLREMGVHSNSYPTIKDGLEAVKNERIDAFVHDAPIIQYYSSQLFQNEVHVLPNTFNDQYYGIALQRNSPLRNEINKVILDYIHTVEWKTIQRTYLGN